MSTRLPSRYHARTGELVDRLCDMPKRASREWRRWGLGAFIMYLPSGDLIIEPDALNASDSQVPTSSYDGELVLCIRAPALGAHPHTAARSHDYPRLSELYRRAAHEAGHVDRLFDEIIAELDALAAT